MKNEVVLPKNIEGVYEEINTLIVSKKSTGKETSERCNGFIILGNRRMLVDRNSVFK